MKHMTSESAALRRAELQSDRIRIIATLGILGLVFTLTFVRRLAFAGTGSTWTLPFIAAFAAAVVAYEASMLWRVTRALRTQSDLPAGAWTANVVVEALIPGVGVVVLVETGSAAPYAALVAPVVLMFFLFISLSTLKLSPALARLSGVCSAVVYVLAAGYVFSRYPEPDLGAFMHPIEYYAGNTAMILAAGFVAGEVARQIRRHVAVALSEAREVEHLRGQLETARDIQRGLLPTAVPGIPGYEIAGWNQPADETGGDCAREDGRIVATNWSNRHVPARGAAEPRRGDETAGAGEVSDLGAIGEAEVVDHRPARVGRCQGPTLRSRRRTAGSRSPGRRRSCQVNGCGGRSVLRRSCGT